MLGLWRGLTRFLDDPRIPLDNNATERGLRGMVIGRKNHYGSRSQRGTEVAALFYSLIESAKLCGVEPKATCSRNRPAVRLAPLLPGVPPPLPLPPPPLEVCKVTVAWPYFEVSATLVARTVTGLPRHSVHANH